MLLGPQLHWRNPNGYCLDVCWKRRKFVDQRHASRDLWRHFAARAITHKILRFGYFWPTLFFDVHKFVRVFHECQMFVGRHRKSLPFPNASASRNSFPTMGS
jgi:hypothetical protein